ncbi:MAG: cytidylate kinase family protein, partial [Alphaproteobacteria bacterium]|nr:cytidylate kinase family protein [Alphaproteobacteria bacterium]
MNLSSSKQALGRDGVDKPIIITISGDLGSGKSMLANALVERWKADRYSTGMVQRKLAERMGITTLELNKRAETDKSIDDQIDSVFKNLSKTAKNLVVDSRMAYHFLPESFRIRLEVHPRVAATRIKGDTSRIGEGTYNSLEEIEAAINARKLSERERFIRYYSTDIADHAGYDLVVNTTSAAPEVVVEVVNACIEAW